MEPPKATTYSEALGLNKPRLSTRNGRVWQIKWALTTDTIDLIMVKIIHTSNMITAVRSLTITVVKRTHITQLLE